MKLHFKNEFFFGKITLNRKISVAEQLHKNNMKTKNLIKKQIYVKK